MKQAVFLFAVALLAGCFTGSPPAPVNWTVDVKEVKLPSVAAPKSGSVRISQLVVRPPYDVKSLTVLRADGTVAFDFYNQFPVSPSSLLKPVAQDVLSASGVFEAVLPSWSSAKTDAVAEISVERLALDCRDEGGRKASVEITLRLLQKRELGKVVHGASERSAADGNYSSAFSEAFADALLSAVSKL